jgi:hypothetical protein
VTLLLVSTHSFTIHMEQATEFERISTFIALIIGLIFGHSIRVAALDFGLLLVYGYGTCPRQLRTLRPCATC